MWGYGSAGWREYCSDENPCGRGGRDDHTTHVHVGLNWNAARTLTAADVQAEFNKDPVRVQGSATVVAPRVPSSPNRPSLRPRAPVQRRRRN